MEQKPQRREMSRKEQSSLPTTLPPMGTKMRIAYFGYGAVPSTLLLAYMSQGQFGASGAIGAVLGGAAAYFAPEIHQTIKPALHTASQVLAYLNRNNSGKVRHRLMDTHWWLTGERQVPYAAEDDQDEDDQTDELKEATSTLPDEAPEPDAQPEQSSSIPAQFELGQSTLEAIKQINSKGFVYFGQTATRQVTLRIDEMYHVLDVAKSGRGKSNRFRNGMMQVVGLADTYYLNPWAASVKSVTDWRQIEVWQPIYDRLANGHPVRESAEILQVLTGLLNLIKVRSDQEQQRDFSWRTHPVFVFIDEVPEIFAQCPEAVKLLDRIGRGGRQFGIFLWLASQSALVTDIGLSTACQAQFKTLSYGGGDRTSANRVMGKVTPAQEETLRTGKPGLTLMKADGVDDTEYVRTPLITNEALFAYLGLPPFQIDEWLAPVSKQPVQNLSPLHSLDLSQDEKSISQAQNDAVKGVKEWKSERRERVKGPNEEAILDALNALEEEEKPLTLNAITKKAGLTWRQAEEIEEAAYWFGYELERGKGRPGAGRGEA
jgi:hypothetical protein